MSWKIVEYSRTNQPRNVLRFKFRWMAVAVWFVVYEMLCFRKDLLRWKVENARAQDNHVMCLDF